MPQPKTLVLLLVLSFPAPLSAQPWSLGPGQTLRYELDVRQPKQPITRQIVELTWTVHDVTERGFEIGATIDRVRVDLKGGGSGFEIDTAREEERPSRTRAALIKRHGASRIAEAVGASFSITLTSTGEAGHEVSNDLYPLRGGLPQGNLRALIETGITFPSGGADEWTFQDSERQRDGSLKPVVWFKGKITRRKGRRLEVAYEAGPRRGFGLLAQLRNRRPTGYTRKGTATFDVSLGCLLKSRERFSIRKEGKFTVCWRYLGERREPPPGTPGVPVVVVSRLTREPIAGAEVRAQEKSVKTDTKGAAEVTTLAGPVIVSAPRFVTMEFSLPGRKSRHKPPFVLKMSPAASLRGRVTDPTGAPLAGAAVEIRSLSPIDVPGRHDTGVAARFPKPWLTETDTDGRFQADALPAGLRLAVAVRPPDTPPIKDDDVELKPGETRELALKCRPFGSVSGRIIDAKGKPVPGATVKLAGRGFFGTSFRVFTADDGSYLFERVPVGRWTLRATRSRSAVEVPGTPVEIRRHGEAVTLKPVKLPPPARKKRRS